MSDAELVEAIRTKDGEKFEMALVEIYRQKKTESVVSLLVEVMLDKWHYKHEDIVLLIQQHKVVGTEDKLLQLALMEFEYLEYDEYYGLARKCTWALADIGSKHAKELLMQLGKCSNPMICDYANERIQNWESEMNRKRA